MTKIIFSPEAEETYNQLIEQKSDTMLKAIKDKIEHIQNNPHFGQPIAKRLIPKRYTLKYGITNLFRIELPYYWRMLYTLTNDDVTIVAFVLEIMDHKKYDKRFNY